MPNGMAGEARAFVAALSAAQRAEYVLEKNPYSSTGFTNIIKVKGGFQARMQVPGDGRGGIKKRRQCPLPGIFPKAEDAAIWLASYKKDLKDAGEEPSSPLKQDKQHKPRTKKQPLQLAAPQPLEPQTQPMATAVALPLMNPMYHVPFAAVSPVPMQPIAYFPPRF